MQLYKGDFYGTQEEGSRRSAEEIVPLVLELVQPRHVIDVGCGLGTWLSVFRKHGVPEVWGVDGEWVDRTKLNFQEERFIPFDLREPFSMPRQFDLVVSLEVAEHLPADRSETFIDSLTGLGPLVLFSAAIPYQGGMGHPNERWPDEWVELFRARGFAVIDCIRRKVWQNDRVEWWYAQNILMFASQDPLNHYPSLRSELEETRIAQTSIVHPKNYLRIADPENRSFIEAVMTLPTLLRRATATRLKRAFAKEDV